MPDRILHIKNMVCPRCIRTVRQLLDRYSIAYRDVQLGKVELLTPLSATEIETFEKALLQEGFELTGDLQSSKVETIRLAIIEWARMLKEYSSISKLFSQMNSMSVERYAILQRIEYAKELLSYGDRSISEIAWELGFSSPAHFSAQFRKETGMSPRQFNALRDKDRIPIDRI